MVRTTYLPIFNHFVYSDLDIWSVTLDQGRNTSFGPV